MYGAFGTLAALLQRERTGQGQIVRTSLLAALIGVHAFQGTRATVAGEVPKAQGNHHPSIAPYGLFHCRQGRVQISVGSEKLWRTFAAEFGIDATRPEFASNADRVRNREKVIEEVERAFSDFEAEAAAHQTQRRRHPGRQGQDPGRGLRLGPGPLAGSRDRRRARSPRHCEPARSRRCGSSAPPTPQKPRSRRTPHRRCWTRTGSRSGLAWLGARCRMPARSQDPTQARKVTRHADPAESPAPGRHRTPRRGARRRVLP